jgi:hypothetical protein
MAFSVYMIAEGTKQGTIKSGSPDNAPGISRGGSLPASPLLFQSSATSESFRSAVGSPGLGTGSSSGSGSGSGKIQHQPVKINKEVDEASPQLLQALWTSELLKNVKIHYWEAPGQKYILKLTNATISSIKPVAIPGAKRRCEQVEFSPEMIEKCRVLRVMGR